MLSLRAATERKLRDDRAVSPVVAVILMVAIAVILAATLHAWVGGTGDGKQAVKNTALGAAGGDDQVTIKHITGEAVGSGRWKVSIVPEGEGTVFCEAASASLAAGAQVVLTRTSNATGSLSVPDCDTAGALPGGTTLAPGDYRVVVVDADTGAVLLDQKVGVR